MDLRSLLHDSPSDDLRARQPRHDPPPDPQPQQTHQQQPPQRPPHHSPSLDRPRDQLRERDRAPQDLSHPSHPHAQHPPAAYRRSPPPHHSSRPPSPPRHAPQYGAPPAGADYPAHSSQRHPLPPPSTLLPDPAYDVGGHAARRGVGQEPGLPHPHDRLGPPPGECARIILASPLSFVGLVSLFGSDWGLVRLPSPPSCTASHLFWLSWGAFGNVVKQRLAFAEVPRPG